MVKRNELDVNGKLIEIPNENIFNNYKVRGRICWWNYGEYVYQHNR